MTQILKKENILAIVKSIDLISIIEEGFIKYSQGKSVIPPVGELLFDNPRGEAHIKYGYIKGDEYYCIKIASGFYNNPNLGISSSQGMMLLFSQETGEPLAALLDDGELTNIRTAAAGAIASKYFAPKDVGCIGILGAGIQGKLQLEMLNGIIACKEVLIWDTNPKNALLMQNQFKDRYDIRISESPAEISRKCNLIITATPSETSLLEEKDIREGTHITAVGSDTANKQELSGKILSRADIIVSDSISQSKSRGEIFRAVSEGHISGQKVVELGTALIDKSLQRTDDNQITVVDLTGVAVQDIMISTAVYNKYIRKI